METPLKEMKVILGIADLNKQEKANFTVGQVF